VLVKRVVEGDNHGHHLKISNGANANAIVKVRDSYSGALLESFFVGKDQTATVTNVPDGTYRVQFGFGDKLGADCKSFRHVWSVSQFADAETFATRYESRSIVRQTLSYTLYTVANGNAHADTIDLAAFNAE
jgi:hypothetical protein